MMQLTTKEYKMLLQTYLSNICCSIQFYESVVATKPATVHFRQSVMAHVSKSHTTVTDNGNSSITLSH